MRIRDETHRRAVSYYRKRSKKKLTRSELDRIAGIGPKRKRLLLRFFGDIDAITKAEFKELIQVPGIAQLVAKNVFDYFRRELP